MAREFAGCLGATTFVFALLSVVGPCSRPEDTVVRAVKQAAHSQEEVLAAFLQKEFDEKVIKSGTAEHYLRQNPACCRIEPVTYGGTVHWLGNLFGRGWQGMPQYLIHTSFGYSHDGAIYYVGKYGRLTRSGRFMRATISEYHLVGESELVCDFAEMETVEFERPKPV